jgi:hypothetical protein
MAAWRGLALATAAGLTLTGCSDDGSLPIYIGGDRVATIGGPRGAASAPNARATAEPDDGGLTLGNIFASAGMPVYVGGRRVNCPDDQPDC